MRKLLMKIHDEKGFNGTETYREGESGSFPVGCPDVEGWAREIVARWNATLRPHESARTIDAIQIVALDAAEAKHVELAHDWHKTNLVTVEDRGRYYDKMKCSRCEITGKRYGLEHVELDRAFRAAGFLTCNGAQALLARRAKKRRPA